MAGGNGASAVLCPRCKVPMIYLMEAEKSSNERRITRYYRCPACGTKVVVERLLVRIVDGKIRIYNMLTKDREVIYARPQPRPRRGRRHR
ncbi:MAG: hypothetical protein GXO68_05240 [Crenarchaeota archaeon]|nr:hypothetical protein [Thermoproteota archaeon]